jgi:hypothetical protein
VETPAFRPRRKRRFTILEMSVVFDSIFVCPVTDCSHARFVWNLAVEQHQHWHPGRGSAPGYLEQCRQLTAARAEHPWLAAGSQMVQQQALRDFAQAMANYFGGTHDRPSWRKAGRYEGFRVVALKPGDVRRLSRHVGEVRVPKAGWVRFRWSCPVPPDVKSYRLTRDRAGRWHVAFAVIPEPIPGPGHGETVGIDRGVAVSAALSTGELLTVPALRAGRRRRLRRLQRRLARARPGSNRRARIKRATGRREGLHRYRPPVRPDQGRGPPGQEHDALGQGDGCEPGPERQGQGRAKPGDPAVGLAPAGASAGGQGVRPGGEGQAGRRRDYPAREPRTSSAAPIGVAAGIPCHSFRQGRMSTKLTAEALVAIQTSPGVYRGEPDTGED